MSTTTTYKPESKLTYTETQAEAYAFLERITGADLDCGDVWANDLVRQILFALEYPRGFEPMEAAQ